MKVSSSAALSAFCMILLSAALPAQAQPSIVIQKFTNGNDADLPPGPILPIGSAVLWTYAVTNYGDVNLTSVAVVDDQGVVVSCPKTTLQHGESMTCTGSGTAQLGQYVNVGIASADGNGTPVSNSDASHYFGQSMDPAISLEKLTNGVEAGSPPGVFAIIGEPVIWTYVVTNQGPVALESVLVTDDQGETVICPKTTLQSGESMTCVATGEVAAGQYRNVGTASGEADGKSVSADDASHYYGVLGVEGCGQGF